ncbi:unnamed protein product [Strongylus vulgaris]|uniref:Uncharacterized protein n=1 Tax=Strongylus vulgaris TaxID=40348 RepID=A0A3P7J4B6_STRVU|nr:unnamed protein product [Strongylus vulgaris]
MTILSFDMLLLLLGATLIVSGFTYECDVTSFPESQRELGQHVCRLENEVGVLEAAVQEMLQRAGMIFEIYNRSGTARYCLSNLEILADITLSNGDEPSIEKRKNEFIRFGKRSLNDVKRKNEFIRFGKRKNEFIRFGRSDPLLYDGAPVEKRKNEFIRFG